MPRDRTVHELATRITAACDLVGIRMVYRDGYQSHVDPSLTLAQKIFQDEPGTMENLRDNLAAMTDAERKKA